MKNMEKPTVIGMRTGYEIIYTCPGCNHKNTMTFNMPKAYYKSSRDGTCGRCKQRFTILTPG